MTRSTKHWMNKPNLTKVIYLYIENVRATPNAYVLHVLLKYEKKIERQITQRKDVLDLEGF